MFGVRVFQREVVVHFASCQIVGSFQFRGKAGWIDRFEIGVSVGSHAYKWHAAVDFHAYAHGFVIESECRSLVLGNIPLDECRVGVSLHEEVAKILRRSDSLG